MKILVKTPTGKILSLEVEQTDTVKEVKTRIYQNEHIAMDQQSLIFIGRRLDDNRDLSYYKIRQDSILYLFSKFETAIKVNVNIQNKRQIKIPIEESDLILTLKERIFNYEKIPTSQQKLLFTGKELENKKRLFDYNIKNDDKLTLEVIAPKSSSCIIL
jgi:ubiquitin C